MWRRYSATALRCNRAVTASARRKNCVLLSHGGRKQGENVTRMQQPPTDCRKTTDCPPEPGASSRANRAKLSAGKAHLRSIRSHQRGCSMSHRFTAFRAAWAGSTVLAAAAFGFAAPAAAQDNAAATEDEGQLATIIVTANRRDENLQDVPVSADILDQERIGAIFSGAADITALAGTAPGLNVESSNGRVATILRPRPWQHRFRSRRIAAGFGAARSTSCSKT